MSMIVVVRLDLDRYDLDVIERLVLGSLITMGEATESRAVRAMDDVRKLMWIREMQRMRQPRREFQVA